MNYIMFTYKNTGFVYDTTGPIAIKLFADQMSLVNRQDLYVDTCIIDGLPLPNAQQLCPPGAAFLRLNPASATHWQINKEWMRGGTEHYMRKYCVYIVLALLLVICALWLVVFVLATPRHPMEERTWDEGGQTM